MLDIKHIRENSQSIKDQLNQRGASTSADLDGLIQKDGEHRDKQKQMETLKNQKNKLSAEVGNLKREGKDASEQMEQVKKMNLEIKNLEEVTRDSENQIRSILLKIPNLPNPSVPVGQDESQNEILRYWGEKPEFDFKIKNHLELGEGLDILDLKRAAKISGARFAVFKGKGATLLRALIQFMLDIQTRENGYQEIYPPVLVKAQTLEGTGQLPKFEEDLFKLNEDPFYLIPTAEVPVTNYHRDEVLKEEELPVAYAAYTLCFRREAGSHGKDTQGIIRQHQFDKVELVKFVSPERSYEELDKLVKDAESILEKLKLPYRVANLCTGDLGFSAAKTFDLEVWIPSQNAYREISSCSNFTDYQARRAKIRFKRKTGGKPELVHTLNGSGLAAGRLFVAVLENYQKADGSIEIPEVIRPYMNGLTSISVK